MSTPLPVVEVSGDPVAMGSAYGRAAGDLIRANVDAYMRRFHRSVGLERAAVLGMGEAFGVTSRQHFPRLAAMLEAMAEAAAVEPGLIYAINARSELLYGSPTCGSPQECTAIGLLGEHTVLAQNWDWHPDQCPYTLFLVTRDELGHDVAVLTEAGMLAKAGLNSAGVGVCVNLLGCDRDGRPGGVPYHVLLRSVLEADSLSWATRNAIRSPRSASINLLIGQPHADFPGNDPARAEAGSGSARAENGSGSARAEAGSGSARAENGSGSARAENGSGSARAENGSGEIIDLELVPGDAGWLHPQDGILVHANHFETSVPVYDTIKDWGGSSLFRSARARRLLQEKKDVLEVLKDHHSAPLAICRHRDDREDEDHVSETIWTVLMDLDDRTIRLIPGPPCQDNPGMTYALAR